MWYMGRGNCQLVLILPHKFKKQLVFTADLKFQACRKKAERIRGFFVIVASQPVRRPTTSLPAHLSCPLRSLPLSPCQ